MRRLTIVFTVFVLASSALLAAAPAANAAWGDVLKIFTGESGGGQITGKSLTNLEMIEGLKEALAKGSKSAVNQLGRTDGFFRNPGVKIPMPESLTKIETTLRTLKQDKLADEFILTMNRAAEKAVPEAAGIFADAIRSMTIADAKGILQGPDNAATQYFRRTSGSQLSARMLPVVKQATGAVGVTAKYKSMVDRLGPVSGLVDTQSLDLDQYVTSKALDGLFKILANEEKLIRKDPAARTTELLKKVFSTP